jgi:hypothetical protein
MFFRNSNGVIERLPEEIPVTKIYEYLLMKKYNIILKSEFSNSKNIKKSVLGSKIYKL